MCYKKVTLCHFRCGPIGAGLGLGPAPHPGSAAGFVAEMLGIFVRHVLPRIGVGGRGLLAGDVRPGF